MMTTQRDIANQLGVSVATVSLALRRDPQISQEMQTRVFAMAEKLNYSYRPRRDVTASSARLAFVTGHTMTETFYAAVLDAAEKECQVHGATLRFVQTARDGPAQSIPGLDTLDGILVIGTFGAGALGVFDSYGLPILLIDNNVPDTPYDRILIDNEQNLYRSVRWLQVQGHRQIAYIHGPHDHWSFRERLRGYKRAMAESALTPLVLDSGDVNGFINFEDTERAVGAWLQTHGRVPFTALAACNDKAAIGAIHALQAAGMRVPEDVSVVGFDDIDAAQAVRPALSTNHVHREVLGRLGTRMLLERLEHPHYPTMRLFVDAEFVERESTAPAAETGNGVLHTAGKEVSQG